MTQVRGLDVLGKFGESFLNFEHINTVRRSFGHVTVARNKQPIGDKLLHTREASDVVNLIENRQGQDFADTGTLRNR